MEASQSGLRIGREALSLTARIFLLFYCMALYAHVCLAQEIESVAVKPSEIRLGVPTELLVRLKSESDSYACAVEIDFGDGSVPKVLRALQESGGIIRTEHTYAAVGNYAIRAKGTFSLLGEGISIQNLLPLGPCRGRAATSVSVLSVRSESSCSPLPDETQTVECPPGTTGEITQRRSFSCPGPVAGPWRTISNSCRAKAEVSGDTDEGVRLIGLGWLSFIGRHGVVDEFEAVRLTAEGIELSRNSNKEHPVSVGLNNLSVFHACSSDPRVRDYELARKIGRREVGKNQFSSDNYIWHVFLRKESPVWQEFVSYLKEHKNTHPVAKYIARMGGKPPASYKVAIEFLMREARRGDHFAAMWVGYSYECGPNPINLGEAITWMTIALERAKSMGVSERELLSIEDRLKRLRLLLAQRG